MNATVNVVCYRSKILSNGEHPLMLRICKDGKKKYQSLNLSINAKYWDFNKEKPKRNCPDREHIEEVISNNLEKVRKQILELKVDGKNFSAQSLINRVNGEETSITVNDYCNKLLDELEQAGKYGNWRIYKSTYNSIFSFTNGKLDILFSDIDTVWLKGYEQWLINKGNKGTTISLQFRTLRAIYNKAIESKCVKKSCYPFEDYKVSKFDTSTKKRAISKKDMKKVMAVELDDPKLEYARDIFVFTYLCGGINFVDIAYLKAINIVDNRIIYNRRKTHKEISIQLLPEAQVILVKYAQGRENNYLFPILDINLHITEKQRNIRIHNVLYMIDKRLKIIAKLAKINTHLTTYVARHSFATVLKRSGVATSIISESLGHSSEKITQIYLDSFESKQIDDAMKSLT